MTKSLLCRQISVCDSIAKLNEEGCFEAIRLLQNVMGLNNLNQFIIKMFMNISNNFTIDNLIKLDNQFSSLKLSNNNNQSKSKQTSNQTYMSKNLDKTIPFPLLRLPIDLISKTSLFLSEQDIFNYEQCCRLFYKMINNTSYLNQSNVFKQLQITDEKLDDMGQSNYSFFKYSKAHKLEFNCDSGYLLGSLVRVRNSCSTELHQRWNKAKIVCKNDKSGWFDSLFKSIQVLKLRADGMLLVDALPIELLFDPIESNLNSIHFNHYWNETDERYLDQYIHRFEKQYLDIQQTFKQQGKQMKILTKTSHINIDQGLQGPKYMSVRHVHTKSVTRLDLSNNDINILSRNNNPRLEKLTCERNIQFYSDINQSSTTQDSSTGANCNMNIKTLRLLHFDRQSSIDICFNQRVIELCNLQNSLTNLLLNIDMSAMSNDMFSKWQKVIESVLQKTYFYKLANVIILLEIQPFDINLIVEILEQNIQLLKYQFTKLIIGFHMLDGDKYYILQWNKDIDDKFLDEFLTLCYNDNDQEIAIDSNEKNKEKYEALAKQWED